jgi:mercuric ion binding protein
MTKTILWIGFALALMVGCSKAPEAKQGTQAGNITVATIQLPTLKCKTCVKTINTALASVDGIENSEINLEKKSATVKFISAKLDIGKIELAISKAGYDANTVKRDSTAYENLAECCK